MIYLLVLFLNAMRCLFLISSPSIKCPPHPLSTRSFSLCSRTICLQRPRYFFMNLPPFISSILPFTFSSSCMFIVSRRLCQKVRPSRLPALLPLALLLHISFTLPVCQWYPIPHQSISCMSVCRVVVRGPLLFATDPIKRSWAAWGVSPCCWQPSPVKLKEMIENNITANPECHMQKRKEGETESTRRLLPVSQTPDAMTTRKE